MGNAGTDTGDIDRGRATSTRRRLLGAMAGTGVAGSAGLTARAGPPPVDDATGGVVKAIAYRSLAAAVEAAPHGSVVYLAPGVYDVPSGGIKLAGRSCVIQGCGRGAVLRASPGHVGPVLDLTGWIFTYNTPQPFQTTAAFGGFSIDGGGIAAGIRMGSTASDLMAGAAFRDIGIYGCAGVPLDLGRAEICTFENVMITSPVAAATGDTPYIRGRGACNGNRFFNVGLRGPKRGANVGPGGAVVLEDDGTNAPYGNLFVGCWDEYLHLPEYSSVVRIRGYLNTISDWATHDSDSAAADATENCWFRFEDAAVENYGGNWVRSLIPGRGDGSTAVAYGAICAQSRNRLEGIKGYNGYNVLLKAGVGQTWIGIGGQQSGAERPAVIDHSRLDTNRLG